MLRAALCIMANSDCQCPLWVKSRHSAQGTRCPLYPQKRTLIERVGMSALCQKRTSRIRSARALSPVSSPSVDKAAVRDRRKPFVVAPAVAAAVVAVGAAAPAADASVAVVAAGAAAPAADA